MNEIGNKNELAFVVDDSLKNGLLKINIWVNNELITYIDNMVNLPQFITSLEHEFNFIKNNEINENYVFFNFGPTTDAVEARAIIEKENIKLSCKLNNGKNINAVFSFIQFVSTYEEIINKLKSINA